MRIMAMRRAEVRFIRAEAITRGLGNGSLIDTWKRKAA